MKEMGLTTVRSKEKLGSQKLFLLCVCMCVCGCVLVTQLYQTLCDSMGYSPPGSSLHGILQARILEWITIPFSKGSP